MIDVLFYLIIFLAFLYFTFRGIVTIFKGLVFFLIALIIVHLFFNNFKVGKLDIFSIPILGRFLKIFDFVENINLTSLRILDYFYYGNSLYIVVKNEGILPIKDFEIFLDDKPTNIRNKPLFLIPKSIANIEVDKKEFKKITIIYGNFKTEYIR
ncbi:MAG: hypothetical protein QXW01_03305 [Candidatus Aenigmatarchaeota archaeon]